MLSDIMTRKLTRYFRVYDVDDDGRIGRLDFERVIENVRILHGVAEGSEPYRALRAAYLRRWEGIRTSADADADGSVDLDEWLDYWREVVESDTRYEAEVAELTARLFEMFDTDEDGVLGPQEFQDFYGVFGLPSDLARSIFQDIDADGDGEVTREELLEVGHEFYRSDDPEAPGNRLFGPI